MIETHDPIEGFRLLFPGSNRPPIHYTKEETDKIKDWMALPEGERVKCSWNNSISPDRFAILFPDVVEKFDRNYQR